MLSPVHGIMPLSGRNYTYHSCSDYPSRLYISNVEILDQAGGLTKLRFNWVTYSFRYKTTDTYFGTSFYTVDTTGERPLIRNKKVILKNDYIHHVVDIYHI
jgi:benzoate/toluate 1,2-dioxygenase beta subunit